MTDQLFATGTSPATPPLRPAERHGRWVLHRAGIVNVWQYDWTEILFAGGRALLRGKNGAGKSKALEVLLPFLLDGDTRSIDAAGRDRTSVYWLMTDGRGTGNHVGYVWLELRCSDEDGGDRFVTLGAGLKAAVSTRSHSSWFFLAEDVRVGVDLHLGPEVSADRLRELLGSDTVTTAAEHRRRVGLRLFGLQDESRYTNLLRLLHRLRDPNIGNRIEAGELASILHDALPPPDDHALEMTAQRFDTLEQIKEQFRNTERTSNALSRFLDTYRGYARTVLRDRSQAVTVADEQRRAAGREFKRLEQDSADANAELEAATARASALRHAERTAGRELEGLRSSDAYKDHLNLVDRRRVVDTYGDGAARAEAHAAQLADLAEQAAGESRQAAAFADEAERATRAGRSPLVTLAQAAGVDPLIVPTDEPGQIPEAIKVVSWRRRAASRVKELIHVADSARMAAAATDEQAVRSEGELHQRRDDTEAAKRDWIAASEGWRTSVRAWAGTELPAPADVHLGWDALDATLSYGTADAGELASARTAALATLSSAQDAARSAAANAAADVAEAERRLEDKERERSTLEATEEARPPRSRFQGAERAAGAGAPFYELVEVAASAGLGAEAQAGLEAALEASGLLDAWVPDDGLLVHPATQDVIVRAGGAPLPDGAATLADVLAATRPPLAPVLRSIGWGDPGPDAAHPWVSADGRWSAGALRGAWTKECSEYLGAGARRETRLRRLAELAAQCAELSVAADAARGSLGERRRAAAALDEHAMAFPGDRAVVAAASAHEARSRVESEAAGRHDADRRRAEQARTVAAQAGAELVRAAGADGLPQTLDEVADLIEATHRLERDLASWGEQWERAAQRRVDAGRLRERAVARRDAAAEGAGGASAARQRHREEAAALDAIEQALQSSVEEVLGAIDEWTRRSDEARAAQPAAEEEVREAADKVGGLREALVAAGERAERSAESVAEAGGRLQRAVALPGVYTAAVGSPADGIDPSDVATLARQVREAVPAAEPVSDQVVLNRLRDLEEGLPGGYDVAAGEDDGVKYFHVADDTGRQPLPAVAERLAAEAAAAARRLDAGEQDVIQRFLTGELGDELRERLLEAHDLIDSTNKALSGQRTSHGIGAHLEWKIDPDAPDTARTTAEMLVKQPRSPDEEAQLRDGLMEMIRAERAKDPALGYLEHLRAALDYRDWYRFAVQVVDDAKPGTRRALHARLGLSQGEQRVVSYLALFAAAAAYYEGLGTGCPRLLLLDDAFAKVDEPTHGRLLRLLIDLDLDFLITSERMWGCFRGVPSLEIYEALREPSVPGVALVHFSWDGHERHLVGL